MAILAWGKGLLETTPCVDGAPAESPKWTAIDTPKEGTLKLTPTAGQETTATEEGGDIVDSRAGKTTYQLEFELFVKKGVELRQIKTGTLPRGGGGSGARHGR